MVFGEAVDPLRPVHSHIAPKRHRVIVQPAVYSCNEEDSTVVYITLLLLRRELETLCVQLLGESRLSSSSYLDGAVHGITCVIVVDVLAAERVVHAVSFRLDVDEDADEMGVVKQCEDHVGAASTPGTQELLADVLGYLRTDNGVCRHMLLLTDSCQCSINDAVVEPFSGA